MGDLYPGAYIQGAYSRGAYYREASDNQRFMLVLISGGLLFRGLEVHTDNF